LKRSGSLAPGRLKPRQQRQKASQTARGFNRDNSREIPERAVDFRLAPEQPAKAGYP
jgi:hypothetical protein